MRLFFILIVLSCGNYYTEEEMELERKLRYETIEYFETLLDSCNKLEE